MTALAMTFITEEEYLALEEDAEEKHEYYEGRIYLMPANPPDHALISANVSAMISGLVRGSACRAHASSLRIKVSATGLNTYPDVTVICGRLIPTEHRTPAATNPSVLVEVLSESTQEYDRGEKWRHYQTVESLTDYLLVWQDRPRVEHFSRLPNGAWEYRMVEGLEGRVRVGSLGGDLLLAEVYRDVEFPETPVLR